MKSLTLNFNNNPIHIDRDAWFNATDMANAFGKRPIDWLMRKETVEYLAILCEGDKGKSVILTQLNKIKALDITLSSTKTKLLKLAKQTGFVKVKGGAPENGGGTWFHRKLAIRFAQWLDTRFAIWCDERIEEILSGEWQQERDTGKAYYRMMTDTLQQSRLGQGKETKAHHYVNEAKLINYALTGSYDGIDRDNADKRTLSGIKRLEALNSALIGMGKTRDERKAKLWECGAEYRNNLVVVAL